MWRNIPACTWYIYTFSANLTKSIPLPLKKGEQMRISVEANNDSYPVLYTNSLIFVSEYQHIRILQKYFHVCFHHTTSRKSVHCETRSCAYVDTDTPEANWLYFVPYWRAWKSYVAAAAFSTDRILVAWGYLV